MSTSSDSKDGSLQENANLLDPDVAASEILLNLEAGLEQFSVTRS